MTAHDWQIIILLAALVALAWFLAGALRDDWKRSMQLWRQWRMRKW
jgi:hypothetical protein